MVIKFKIKEMHFKNANHWEHTLYKKILNMFTLLKDFFNSFSLLFVSMVNYDILPLQDLPNFDLNFSLSDCTDSVDSCNNMFMCS